MSSRSFASANLSIAAPSGSAVVVAWPDTNPPSRLQTNVGLSASSWGYYAGTINDTNGSNMAAIPLESGAEFFRLQMINTGFSSPLSIPALAYFWNYNDLTTGSTVSNWTDEVSGLVWGRSFNPTPTATSLGVGFFNCNGLTCSAINLSSNFSVWLAFRPTAIDTESLLLGSFESGSGLCLSNGMIDGFWSGHHIAGGIVPTNQVYPAPSFFSVADSEGILYTNGALAGAIGQPTNNFPFDGVGNNTFTSEDFPGDIEYVGIWTNYALSPNDIANLNSWAATNGVTNITSGQVAWWRLDEGSGANVLDSSGNGNNGVFAGTGTSWTNGVNGSALNFSGTGQANTTNCADNLSAMTVSFWVRSTNFNFPAAILNKNGPGGSDTGQGWGFFSDSTANIAAYTQDSLGNWIETPHNGTFPVVADGNWHFIACTFSNLNTLEMYIDGVYIAGPYVGTGGVTSTSNNGVVVLGGDSANVESPCTMDDVRIYSRILSQNEIVDLFRWRGHN